MSEEFEKDLVTPEAIDEQAVESADAVQDESADIYAALDARADFYDFIAALYFRPLKQEQIENIAAMDLSAYAEVNEYFADGLNDITRYLRKRNTGTRQALAVDFTAAFAGTSSWKGKYAVPYESVFTSEEGLMYQESFHEVYHIFKKNRVSREEGYDYPDDHLSFMCNFLAILSRRIKEALQEGRVDDALLNLKASREFLDAHMLSWFDPFQALALKLLETRFYRGILKITKGYFLFDRELMDEIISMYEPVED